MTRETAKLDFYLPDGTRAGLANVLERNAVCVRNSKSIFELQIWWKTAALGLIDEDQFPGGFNARRQCIVVKAVKKRRAKHKPTYLLK